MQTPKDAKAFVQMRPDAKLPSLDNISEANGAGQYTVEKNELMGHTYNEAHTTNALKFNDRTGAVYIGGKTPLGKHQGGKGLGASAAQAGRPVVGPPAGGVGAAPGAGSKPR